MKYIFRINKEEKKLKMDILSITTPTFAQSMTYATEQHLY